MPRPKVRDERPAVPSRRIVESVGGCVATIDQDHALQPRRDGQEGAAVPHRLGLAAADDLRLPPADPPFEAFARALAYLAGVNQLEMLAGRGLQNGLRQR